MPLDKDQKNRLALGGTTGLPSPFPTIGTVRMEKDPSPDANTLVHVTDAKSPSAANVWSIRAGDIAAFEEKSKVLAKDKKVKWHIGVKNVLKALKDGKKKKGIVYVSEETQVLLRLEHGLSAIDSVDVASEAGAVPSDRTTDEKFGIQCDRDPCNA